MPVQEIISPTRPIGILPYFTENDPSLARQSTGRDPLGMLPVWSEIGRGLVPCIASPVLQLNGVKAVLLIHWLTDVPALQPLLEKKGRARGFFRLMEGVVEYWLHKHRHTVCFGSQALHAGGEEFRVSTGTARTVANGLHQYYRGTCQRAELLDDAWRVDPGIGSILEGVWSRAATNALVAGLEPCLASRSSLLPARMLANPVLDDAFARVFGDRALHERLDQLFGSEVHRALAREYLELRSLEGLRRDERIARLASDHLGEELDRVRRCEPFLLVLQDVFDLMRASSTRPVRELALELSPFLQPMRERARAFLPLGDQVRTRRMGPLRELAQILAAAADDPQPTLDHFIRSLATHHATSMRERRRDPMVIVEHDVITAPVEADRNPAHARQRLIDGHPWMNDYYLNTASTLYRQSQETFA
jgi:hypothetical protein